MENKIHIREHSVSEEPLSWVFSNPKGQGISVPRNTLCFLVLYPKTRSIQTQTYKPLNLNIDIDIDIDNDNDNDIDIDMNIPF